MNLKWTSLWLKGPTSPTLKCCDMWLVNDASQSMLSMVLAKVTQLIKTAKQFFNSVDISAARYSDIFYTSMKISEHDASPLI